MVYYDLPMEIKQNWNISSLLRKQCHWHYQPSSSHNWRHSSETTIQHHCLTQVVGMSLLLSLFQSSFYDCTNMWGSRNCVLVDCNIYSHNGCQSSFYDCTNKWGWQNCVYVDCNVLSQYVSTQIILFHDNKNNCAIGQLSVSTIISHLHLLHS